MSQSKLPTGQMYVLKRSTKLWQFFASMLHKHTHTTLLFKVDSKHSIMLEVQNIKTWFHGTLKCPRVEVHDECKHGVIRLLKFNKSSWGFMWLNHFLFVSLLQRIYFILNKRGQWDCLIRKPLCLFLKLLQKSRCMFSFQVIPVGLSSSCLYFFQFLFPRVFALYTTCSIFVKPADRTVSRTTRWPFSFVFNASI